MEYRLDEPLLIEDNTRFIQLPIKYQKLQDAYDTHESMFWSAKEIDYSADLPDWYSLSDDERYFIEHILAFFAGSDGIVLENLIKNFCIKVKATEARNFYAFQGMMENIHGMTYALLLDTLVTDNKRKESLFNAIETIPCVKKKADWALKWMNPDRFFEDRVVAFAIVEGIFFSASFASIFWLKSRNKMTKALGKSNELISRDEGLHCISKGTLVSIDSFMSIPIEELEKYNCNVLTYDETKDGIIYNEKTNFKFQGKKECIELIFEDGRTLKCTPDHKILTKNGWVEADKILLNKDKVLLSIENPYFEKNKNDILQEKIWKLEIGDKYIFSTDTIENIKKACAFARVLGYILTDGSISKGKYSWNCILPMGNLIDANNIQTDIYNAFGEIIDNVIFHNNVYNVRIKSSIVDELVKLEDILTGDRSINDGNCIPKFIFNAPRVIVANFLSGLYGGDGCCPTTKKNTSKINKTYKFSVKPSIGFVFSKSNKIIGLNYQQQLIKLLSLFNIKAKGSKIVNLPIKKKNIQKYKFNLVINGDDISKFYKNIGFACCSHKHLRLGIACSVKNLRDKIKEQNDFVVNKFNEISDYKIIYNKATELGFSKSKKSGYINKNIKGKLDDLRDEAIKEWAKNNPLYGKIKSSASIRDNLINRTDGTVPNLNEENLLKSWNVYEWFSEDVEIEKKNKHTPTTYCYKQNSTQLPYLEMNVIYKKNAGELDTYDISVKDTHNFIANGVIVHNCTFAVLMYHHLNNKISQERIEEIVREAVDIEIEFICDSIPCRLIGMNSDLMSDYVKYVADRLLIDFGFEKIYNKENPFDFMKSFGLDDKSNFFESKVTMYQHASTAKATENSWDFGN